MEFTPCLVFGKCSSFRGHAMPSTSMLVPADQKIVLMSNTYTPLKPSQHLRGLGEDRTSRFIAWPSTTKPAIHNDAHQKLFCASLPLCPTSAPDSPDLEPRQRAEGVREIEVVLAALGWTTAVGGPRSRRTGAVGNGRSKKGDRVS